MTRSRVDGDGGGEVPSFDVCGPLPRGTTLLEASAGTGKTFTIAALTARYVAEEGLPIERLLVITFTRMATGELRERVRDRLVRAFNGLVDVLAGKEAPENDDILQLLAAVHAREQEQRCSRLAKAIADFDAATIETTHGFCLQVLYGLGTAGDVDRDVTLVEDVRDMVDEVVDDLYLRKFAVSREHDRASRGRMPAKSLARLSASPTPTFCLRCPTGMIWKRRAAVSPSACARRWRSASAPSRSSHMTTSSFACATPSAIHPGDQWRVPACVSDTTSSSSTSSRTPIPCSGTS